MNKNSNSRPSFGHSTMTSIVYILAALLVFQAISALGAQISPFITGGKDAYPGEYPYQVSVQYGVPPLIKYRAVCGGALVSTQWVVTSASCITLIPKIGKIQVKVGLQSLDKDNEWVQKSEVLLRIVHSSYKSSILKKIKSYDIALLKLKNPVNLNSRVQLINFPDVYTLPKGNAILTGWGSVSKNIIPSYPNVLQKANVTILSESNCNDALQSLTDNEKLTDIQFCTGPLDQKMSACLGDLGDPLMQTKNGSQVLVGITSWSPYPCGKEGSPTVYTLASAFVYWIEERIIENS